MRSFLVIFLTLMSFVMSGAVSRAQGFSGLARIDPAASSITDVRRGLVVDLGLSQAVPYRVFTLDDPARLVVDFREVDWTGLSPEALLQASHATGVRFGTFRPGWSRMIVDLAGPMALVTASMATDAATGDARVTLRLSETSAADFSAKAGAPDDPGWDLPDPASVPAPKARQRGDRPLQVVLDPGHGGVDPGAERDGLSEADLMLRFALELKEALVRAGNFEVTLTREDDSFVPLETRITLARAAGADVFLSLHADALAEGGASGATIYTLSDSASDEASELLAQRHDRADLLAGVDLTEQDDVIASVLMEMARRDTTPRSDSLADHLVRSLRDSIGRMHKRPRLSAGFSVLKAPDFPSVLIELGFLSSPQDITNLQTPEWRARAIMGIRQALQSWAVSDAAEAGLLRQ